MSLASPEIYSDVFDRLEHEDARYAVISGVAVVLHGHVRPIADLDIVIDPTPDEADRVLRALANRGFVPSIPLPLNMLSVLRMFDHAQREVDVFLRWHVPFNDVWADSARMRVGASVARVASLAHILHVKRINGRPHDLLDITGLQLALEARSSGAREESV